MSFLNLLKKSDLKERETKCKLNLVREKFTFHRNQDFSVFSNPRISEIKEKIESVQEEIRNLDMDLEEHQGMIF